jgi:hypothetical protein
VVPGGPIQTHDRLERPLNLRLLLHDAAYLDRLAAFLESVGQRPVVIAPDRVELSDIAREELEVYLRVWHVLYPEAAVVVGG